jgi:D-galactose 1-dehydrogenase
MALRKIAIIGYGKIAQDQHGPAIAGSGAFELAAVVSGHADSIPGVERIFKTPAELYREAPDIDCVAVCNPPGAHFASVREALEAGKHVLLEKPPASTVGEARALGELAKSQGRTLFATWHARANAPVREAARRLAGQDIDSMLITWKEDVRKWHPGQAWIWEANGFGVFDPGINALSIATAVMPLELIVRQAKLSVPANRQQPIAADIVFESQPAAGSLTAAFDWRQTGPQTWTIEVKTKAGQTLTLTEGGGKLAVDGQPIELAPTQEYPDLYHRFAELLDKGESDVDLRPFELVADAFMCADRTMVEPFEDEPS